MTEATNRVARMHFDEEDRILYITSLPDALYDLESAKEHYDMISELTGDRDHYALIDSTYAYVITDEATDYCTKPDVLRARKAAAYFQPNLANRYKLMQLQIKMRATIPTCMFSSRDEAMLWLRSLNLVKKDLL